MENTDSPTEAYGKLLHTRDRYAEKLPTASDALRAAYEKGIQNAEQRLGEIVLGPEARDEFIRLGADVLQEYEEFEQLREDGLVDEEILEAVRAELDARTSDPEFVVVWDAIKRIRNIDSPSTTSGIIKTAAKPNASAPSGESSSTVKSAKVVGATEPVKMHKTEAAQPQKHESPETAERQAMSPEKVKRRIPIHITPDLTLKVARTNRNPIELIPNRVIADTPEERETKRTVIAHQKVAILMDIAANPEIRSAKNIWESALPEDDFDRSVWHSHIRPFVRQLSYRDKPIVSEVVHGSRIMGYGLTDYDVEVYDKRVSVASLKKTTAPTTSTDDADPTEKKTKTQRFKEIAMESNQENLVTRELVESIYDAEELANKFGDPFTSIFAGSIRRLIQRDPAFAGYELVKVEELNQKSSRTIVKGYYLQKLSGEDNPDFLGQNPVADDIDTSIPQKRELTPEEINLERINNFFSLSQAVVLAKILDHHREHLIDRGIQVPKETLMDSFDEETLKKATEGLTPDSLELLRKTSINAARFLLGNPWQSDDGKIRLLDWMTADLPVDDPRQDIIIYIMHLKEDDLEYLKELVAARMEMEVNYHRNGWQLLSIKTDYISAEGKSLVYPVDESATPRGLYAAISVDEMDEPTTIDRADFVRHAPGSSVENEQVTIAESNSSLPEKQTIEAKKKEFKPKPWVTLLEQDTVNEVKASLSLLYEKGAVGENTFNLHSASTVTEVSIRMIKKAMERKIVTPNTSAGDTRFTSEDLLQIRLFSKLPREYSIQQKRKIIDEATAKAKEEFYKENPPKYNGNGK